MLFMTVVRDVRNVLNIFDKNFKRMIRSLQSRLVNHYKYKGIFSMREWFPYKIQDLKLTHTDIKIPDFSKYRRKSVINPQTKDEESADARKASSSIWAGFNIIVGCYSAKTVIQLFVKSMAMSADVQALAKIEVNLAEISEGGHATLKWRGKPLFLKHRLPEEIKDCQSTPVSSLRDPQTDEERCPVPEWLVVIGVCTHLGCVPIPNSGDYLGGYYCPCHGSHYDAAGRIRKGPAPSNLEIPIHNFQTDNSLVVG